METVWSKPLPTLPSNLVEILWKLTWAWKKRYRRKWTVRELRRLSRDTRGYASGLGSI
jgi:hypothetical protein